MRLQKYMASCGVASRRKSEELIAEGKVTVNGEKVVVPGFDVNPETDIVMVNGENISPEKHYYFLFNKPSNVLCTAGNPRGRSTVYDYFKEIDARLFTVGRLDYKTSGVIIVTNDGDFAHHISHPSHEKEKEYTVKINGFLSDKDIMSLQDGMNVDEYITSPAQVMLKTRSPRFSEFNIIIHEGRNRQIRKMVETLGHKISFLQRIRIAHLTIGNLKEGSYRLLSRQELDQLKKII